ncbi:hypothetical protein Droror1_Dr00000426 [Drosera rotundifolia]
MLSSIVSPQLASISACRLILSMSMTDTTKKNVAVLYHYPCPDGAFAALAAHLYFSATSSPVMFFPNRVYDPVKTEHLPLDEIEEAYLLDFVGPSGFIQDLAAKVEQVVLLDHHKTALEMLSNEEEPSRIKNVIKVLDMDRSGATIAHDFFKQKLCELIPGSGDEAILAEFDRLRKLFEYIEDGDLWKWRLENSKAFNSGLKDIGIEFDVGVNPAVFDQLRSLELKSVISEGTASLAKKQKLIDEALDQAFKISLGRGEYGHCLAAYADSIPELRSDLGHQLACKSRSLDLLGIGAVVYKVPELGNDEVLKVSLRSDDEDTTAISQRFGGGGHRCASSFMLSLPEFETWKLKI